MSSIAYIYADFMSQNYSDAKKTNLFKIGLLYFIKERAYQFSNEPLNVIAEYVYRFVRDNQFLIETTSNVILKNISKYEPSDLIIFLEQDIKEWVNSGTGFLNFYNGLLSTKNFNELSPILITQLEKVVDAISIKNLGKLISYNSKINYEEIKNIKSAYELKKTRLWNRSTEKIKFCMCCNDSNIENLYIAYIVLDSDKIDKDYLVDPNNTIVLCKEHMELYQGNFFSFDSSGKIQILKNHSNLDQRMRISRVTLTKERQQYLNKFSNIK